MRCTANTRLNLLRDGVTDVRCQRPIGHGGLHRYVEEGTVYEFRSEDCWLPHYSVDGSLEEVKDYVVGDSGS